MKFYDRKREMATLKEVEKLSVDMAQMTVVVGRRRIGKTTLLKKSFESSTMIYLFVAKKSEVLLCQELVAEIEAKLNIYLGEFKTFSALFQSIMLLSKRNNFTFVIDEFQEFMNINSSIYSDMQNIWDSNKNESQLNLILCGSIYSMMKRIFENSKEPLFGRASTFMNLKPFDIETIKEILGDYSPNYSSEDLLAFYMITGGVAKYIEELIRLKAFTKTKIINSFFTMGSYFLNEGKSVLIDEFGRDYGVYFSILSLIASSKSERSEIEDILGIPVGGYLDRLEKEYSVIKKVRPFGAKEGSRSNKYLIEDNFLNIWFRFIYKYRSAVEIGNLDYVKEILERDYEVYSGFVLEKYFKAKLIDAKQYSDIQGYWDRKGENEIDIVALNDMNKQLDFFEVKRNKKKIDLQLLETKSQKIINKFSQYSINYIALSMEDM
ncbi:MAG: ATP-binding protein [bacterium]